MACLLQPSFQSMAVAIDIATSPTTGNPTDTSELELRADRVIVFKDGYCLVVKHGTATTDADGVVFTDDVPDAAVLGSFWAIPEQGTIRSLVAGWVESEATNRREVNCTSILEIVHSNLGKSCSFEVDQQLIEGTLLQILSNQDSAQELAESRLGHQLTGELVLANTAVTTAVSGEYFLVRTLSGDKMIQVSAVRNLTIQNMNSRIESTVTTTSRHKRLSMKFGEPNQPVNINLMYFRPDVRWIPTYHVNLTQQPASADARADVAGHTQGNKRAELIMQGEILNEAEDFIDVPFHVVVGVPNFRFRTLPSPMILEATLRNALGQAAPAIMALGNNRFSNGLYSQRAGEWNGDPAQGENSQTTIALPDELIGKGGNDLYVYELPRMTLKRGERALVPILSTEVAYRDVYTWDIQLTHAENQAAISNNDSSPLLLSETKVWRQIELINNTNIPWTTGAAMLMDGSQPLAQELLTYTSPGGRCRVPVTVAIDLRGKATDVEIAREFDALKWRGDAFARVNGKIEAELANNKAEPVSVEVMLRFGGKANQASDNGIITLAAFRSQDWHEQRGNAINNSSVVRWTERIQPGECFKPTIDYEFFLQY